MIVGFLEIAPFCRGNMIAVLPLEKAIEPLHPLEQLAALLAGQFLGERANHIFVKVSEKRISFTPLTGHMDVDDSAVLFRAPPHDASLGGQTVDRGAYRGLGDVERLRDPV